MQIPFQSILVANLLFISCLSAAEVGKTNIEGSIKAASTRPGVIDVPLIRAQSEDTDVGIEKEVTSVVTGQTKIDKRTAISHNQNSKDTSATDYSETVKKSISLSLSGSNSNPFSAKVDGGIGFSSSDSKNFHSVREQSSDDATSLNEFEAETKDTSIKFSANSGYFRSAVRLRSLSGTSGHVDHLRVSLHVGDPYSGSSSTIASQYVCDINGAILDVSAHAAAVTAAVIPLAASASAVGTATSNGAADAQCRILVPAYDPAAPSIEIPVSFTGFNTGIIQGYLDKKVWIEIDALKVALNDKLYEGTFVDDVLKSTSITTLIIDENGKTALKFVDAAHGATPRALLKTIYADQVEFDEPPLRITRIGPARRKLPGVGECRLNIERRISMMELGSYRHRIHPMLPSIPNLFPAMKLLSRIFESETGFTRMISLSVESLQRLPFRAVLPRQALQGHALMLQRIQN